MADSGRRWPILTDSGRLWPILIDAGRFRLDSSRFWPILTESVVSTPLEARSGASVEVKLKFMLKIVKTPNVLRG